MNVTGTRVGVDVVIVPRLARALERCPELEERLFLPVERDYCRRAASPVESFAGTLAAKEAVIKALKLGRLVSWASRIVVERDERGAPVATVRRATRETVDVSISHDGDVAIAAALYHPREDAVEPDLGPWLDRI